MTECFYIAVGGACGALARHGTNLLAARWLGEAFPFGTLMVNVAGCFVIGMLWQILANSDSQSATGNLPAWRSIVQHGLSTGFLGGLTTFSAFGLQSLLLVERQQYWMAAGNVALNVVLGLVAAAAGVALIRSST